MWIKTVAPLFSRSLREGGDVDFEPSTEAGKPKEKPRMTRKFALFLSFGCLILLGLLMIGCGGSCTGRYNVVGNWDINVGNDSPNLSNPGVISSSGLAVFESVSARYSIGGVEQLVPDVMVMPSITGACSFSGTGTDYGFDGPSSVAFSMSGKVKSTTSIGGTIETSPTSIGGAVQTNGYSMGPISPLSGSVAILPNSMSGEIEGPATDSLTLTFSSTGENNNSSMTVSGSDTGGCTVSGTLNQEGSSNVFDVSIAISGSKCPLSTLSGLGFESNWDVFDLNPPGVPGAYMYVISSSSDEVLEIYHPSVN